MVPETGLEPVWLKPLDFESSASAIPPLRHIPLPGVEQIRTTESVIHLFGNPGRESV